MDLLLHISRKYIMFSCIRRWFQCYFLISHNQYLTLPIHKLPYESSRQNLYSQQDGTFVNCFSMGNLDTRKGTI